MSGINPGAKPTARAIITLKSRRRQAGRKRKRLECFVGVPGGDDGAAPLKRVRIASCGLGGPRVKARRGTT